jgi:hypothetical protein
LEKATVEYRWLYGIRQGRVLKCVKHKKCGHKIQLLRYFQENGGVMTERNDDGEGPFDLTHHNDFIISESGTHPAEIGLTSSRGIHSIWQAEADRLLVAGNMPKKTYMLLHQQSKDETREVLPTVQQLANRKRFLFKPENKLDTVSSLKSYLRKFTVIKIQY